MKNASGSSNCHTPTGRFGAGPGHYYNRFRQGILCWPRLEERAGQLDQIALPNEGTLAKYYNPLIETITHALNR